MDISSKGQFPSSVLSNFTQNMFEIDQVFCFSMEGFLQSLKFEDEDKQREICRLVGFQAKKVGQAGNDWKETQTLWWKGVAYKRDSREYQELLDRAYQSLGYKLNFQEALLATGDEELTHSIGSQDPTDTVLTEKEFCSRLSSLRDWIKKSYKYSIDVSVSKTLTEKEKGLLMIGLTKKIEEILGRSLSGCIFIHSSSEDE